MPPADKQAILETAREASRHFGDALGVFQSDGSVFSANRDIEAETREWDIHR